jgi:hypothetical protein
MASYSTQNEGKDLAVSPMQTAAQRRRVALAEVDEAKFSVCLSILISLTTVVSRQGLPGRRSWIFD